MESPPVVPTLKKDVVVIGAGPGGYVAAIRLGQLGKKVLLVDGDQVGGTCLNYGCIPSKALIHFANLFEKVQKAEVLGLKTTGLSADLKVFQAWKKKMVSGLTQGIATLCKNAGVEILPGRASYKSPREIEISSGGTVTLVESQYSIIATGASSLALPGFSKEISGVLTSKEALELSEVPPRFLVIGGGVIGLELGMAFQKLGSHLIVVELLDRLLAEVDSDLVRFVERSIKKRDGEIYLKSKALRCKKKNGIFEAEFETPEGLKVIQAEAVLVAVGVEPNTRGLGLEKIGVATDKKGYVVVNEFAQTSVPNIYAIGDVNGPPWLAHKAFKEGEVAAEVISGLKRSLDYYSMPAAIFTDPEIATVGVTEKQAKEQGRQVILGRYPLAASGRALSMNEGEGLMKVVVDEKSGEVLGVGLACVEASELISEGALAIEMGAFAQDVASTIHPHPTLSEGIMEAFKQTLGEAIHIINPAKRPYESAQKNVRF